ncbi:MAG: thiamine pyrophosphate-binding protein [Spirochaetaceae bacterium]|nr:MAG: thiamine pyrophosphate-binding protein [Spirochaetaceae bacterium]
MTSHLERRERRAGLIRESGSMQQALEAGTIEQFQDVTLSEALVLGLLNQGVRRYVGVFGHGSTDIAEVLRTYQQAGLLRVFNVRHETEASHAAAQLRWQYGERAAVITSIGPGALHAFAGSLVAQSNGLGVYYIFGDETTHNEGPNMQQIARREQDLFLRLTSTMGGAYSLGTPEAVFTALKWGYNSVFSPAREEPFFLLLPMNVQGQIIKGMNLAELPLSTQIASEIPADKASCTAAAEIIRRYRRITLKVGGGARTLQPDVLARFLDLSGAVYVHGPQVPGILPDSHERNMTVGGSKGSISGNFAMENCELAIIIGARGVCQWDSSGTAWRTTREIININTRLEDAMHYNRSFPLVGDCTTVLRQLNAILEGGAAATRDDWHILCQRKRAEWDDFRQKRIDNPLIYDSKWGRQLLTQPAVLDRAIRFADSREAVKIFDAGDVQANGFQLVRDYQPRRTFTDTGSSYMGFAVSALLASAMSESPDYSIAFTGDGSFLMSPQILLDAVQFNVRGMIVLLDNRRMAAISGLQTAQYGADFATDDQVNVDYVQLARAFTGVSAFGGVETLAELDDALSAAYQYDGLSIVYVPVYSGPDDLGGLGVFGSWNVGNWCDQVQSEKHRIGL